MMLKLSKWAARNKYYAIVIVTLLSLSLSLLGFEIGLFLFAQNILLPTLVGLLLFIIAALLRYQLFLMEQQKHNKKARNYYYQFKKFQGGLYAAIFFLFMFCGNYSLQERPILSDSSSEVLTSTQQEFSFSYLFPPRSKAKKGWFKKQLSKRAKKYRQLKPSGNEIQVLGTILISLLLIVVVVGIGYLTLVLACSAFCNDLVVLGVLALIGGMGLISLTVYGAVKWLQWIWTPFENPVE